VVQALACQLEASSLHAGGKNHRYKKSCVWNMTQVAEGKIAVVTDAEAIQEILCRYGAIHHWETGVAIANSLDAACTGGVPD